MSKSIEECENIEEFVNELIADYRAAKMSSVNYALITLGQPQYDLDLKKLNIEIEQLKKQAKKILKG